MEDECCFDGTNLVLSDRSALRGHQARPAHKVQPVHEAQPDRKGSQARQA
jgi:hypothetical protein